MMEKTGLIPAKDFCLHHSISYTFVTGLCEAGLVEVVTIEQEQYIHPDYVAHLEKLARLHTELEINMEGIEAIAHLLHQVEELQQQVRHISGRLQMYEDL